MSKTYLITGATSPLGLALMERLLPTLAEGDLILAQGCGDLARLASLCQARPGFIRPYDADFTQPLAVRAFLSDLVDTYPAPTHIIHLPGLRPHPGPLTPIFDEERFADDRAVQLDSALLLCKTFLPRMAPGRKRPGPVPDRRRPRGPRWPALPSSRALWRGWPAPWRRSTPPAASPSTASPPVPC